MSIYRYIYNASSLRYERARHSIGSVGMYLIGLLLCSATFFVGLVYIQNYIIETPLEASLRAENKALQHFQVELTGHLENALTQLNDLESKDNALYEKIFEARKVTKNDVDVPSNKEILIAEENVFHDKVDEVVMKYNRASQLARQHNRFYRQTASVTKDDIGFLTSVPSIAPVPEMDAVKLVSGFGIRINPFHKRNYHHDGVDVISSRGVEVIATAPGRVAVVSHNDLQAGYGNFIEIDHGHGFVTRYANLGEIGVYYGKAIKKGETIGRIGISGGSVAPHVHYEVLLNGHNLDPVRFLLQGVNSKQYDQIWQASLKQNQSLD